MTLFLKESTDCRHISTSNLLDNKNDFQPKAWEYHLHDPQGKSHGCRRWFHLRPGISLLVDDYTLKEDLVLEIPSAQPSTCLELSFSILGHNTSEDVLAGQNFLSLYQVSGDDGWIEWQAQDRILKFDIHIEYSLLQCLFANQMDTLPVALRQAIENGGSEVDYLQIGATTSEMQTIIRGILNCPYQGITKQLYLEGKVLELMALRFEYLKENSHRTVQAVKTLKPHQVESIYQARDILINSITNPPSLLCLSRQVGLNDCTLKKGFQEVFGTTAFGYLYNYRMEKARGLLLEKQMSIAQVAQAVGYEARSSFIRAFCHKFGAKTINMNY